MADRIFAALMLIIVAAYSYSALGIREGFMTDPLGPKAFPFLLAFIVAICSISILLRPATLDMETWPDANGFVRIFSLAGLFFLYAYALKPLGFLIPTALIACATSYMISPNLRNAVFVGAGLSLGLFFLFKVILGLSLFAFGRGF